MFRRKSLSLIGLGLAGLSTSFLFSLNEPVKAQKPIEITLVSYAVTQGAYSKIIPQFTADWKKKTGQNVVFRQSYGGSGSQTRAVIDGLEADVVALALAGDTKKIEQAGLIKPGWEKESPNNAIVTKSVVAFITRPGKPQIKSWNQLADPKIKVITANPKTSGGAKWNFLGLWASVIFKGGTEAQAKTFVDKVYNSVPVLPKDARESTDVFIKQGQGDVLLNYENEAILAKQKGARDPYFIPTDVNISIDNPIAVVDKNVDKHNTRKVAEAFVKFTFTPPAQREFAKVGFRPTNTQVAKEFSKQFPSVKKLVTVNDLGGWSKIDSKFFADKGIFDQIIRSK
ncbi:sulfate ABC transporter substrate-binding protein [Geminocystis sp. NIES-3709]|uniref:sulfate ABC transporter substrate-binding protein n=1 Tax=Geminocystis sp. NIES-3709 TaxID=1617448 RepID=UPI0005FCA6F3|nr:sulfate ABC transporter substrate-binding protein [Geminocystis sp. NIES-3709]BAQ65736.1 sulfate and thiosulfate binding protein CysP [Geminocystis sp. NIES-3709]